MGIREQINQSKRVATAVICGTFVAAIGMFVWANSDGTRGPLTEAYFSNDDGRTFFAESVNKVPPFEHGGKEAVQAFVYRAGGNPPFVGYLQKYPPETAARMRDLLNGPPNDDAANRLMEMRAGALVKKPGEATWHSVQSEQATRIVTIAPPAGQTGDLRSVDP